MPHCWDGHSKIVVKVLIPSIAIPAATTTTLRDRRFCVLCMWARARSHAFQTLPSGQGMAAIAFLVSTMTWAQLASWV